MKYDTIHPLGMSEAKILSTIEMAITLDLFTRGDLPRLINVIIEDQAQNVSEEFSWNQNEMIESLKFDYRVFAMEEAGYDFERLSACDEKYGVSHHLVSNNDLSFVGMFDMGPPCYAA